MATLNDVDGDDPNNDKMTPDQGEKATPSYEGFAEINRIIADAEEFRDPLEGLVDKSISDPSAPFAPDTIMALAALKEQSPQAFEKLRAELKDKTKCRLSELDKAIAAELRRSGGSDGDLEEGPGATQFDTLIAIVAEGNCELFHTPDGTAYADIYFKGDSKAWRVGRDGVVDTNAEVGGHRETWPIASKNFRDYLFGRFLSKTGRWPSSEAQKSILDMLEGKARCECPEREVCVRVGTREDKIYVDLSDDSWRAVEIDSAGWRVVETAPVRFRRAKGMKALPVPERDGSLQALRPFVNVASEKDFTLINAWLLGTFQGKGPYPILVLTGQQGSAKSTTMAILRSLTDPNIAPLRNLSRDERDMFISAENSHVLAFDNVSGLPPWLSDALCRLSTGGGMATRTLYANREEEIFRATRPTILNGIPEFATRPDLVDRTIIIELAPISEEARRTEEELWAAFEAVRPAILGCLLDGMVQALRRYRDVRLSQSPRMADFARLAVASEPVLWPEGSFELAYVSNREMAMDTALEADLVGDAVRRLMATNREWVGTATELLALLAGRDGLYVSDEILRRRDFPTSPKALSDRLRRIAPFLKQVGITVVWLRDKRRRSITITNIMDQPSDEEIERDLFST